MWWRYGFAVLPQGAFPFQKGWGAGATFWWPRRYSMMRLDTLVKSTDVCQTSYIPSRMIYYVYIHDQYTTQVQSGTLHSCFRLRPRRSHPQFVRSILLLSSLSLPSIFTFLLLSSLSLMTSGFVSLLSSRKGHDKRAPQDLSRVLTCLEFPLGITLCQRRSKCADNCGCCAWHSVWI